MATLRAPRGPVRRATRPTARGRRRPLRHAASGSGDRALVVRPRRVTAALLAAVAGGGIGLAATGVLPAGAAVSRPSPRGTVLWVDPNTQAAAAARALAAADPTRTADVARLTAIAQQPQGTWVTGSLSASAARARVAAISTAAAAQGRMPTFVLYALPHLDCRSGGIPTAAGYRAWVDAVTVGLAGRPAIVVVEPDALALLGCLSSPQASERLALLRYAVSRLSTDPAASVYLDAGHNGWQSSSTMAARLTSAGVSSARGFSLNVSNFGWTADEVAYGSRISAKLVEPRPFVVDVGRNGLGPDTGPLAWCNPPGRALGEQPGTSAVDPQVDALLWVKPPGESDGVCRAGEPPAGRFWVAYALGLATLSSWANPAP